MTRSSFQCTVFLWIISTVVFNTVLNAQILPERQWPAYRGYMSSGVLDNADLPGSFDLSSMANIRWKAEIAGLGISSPVIWGDKLFITTAVSQSDKSGFKTGLYGDVQPVNDSSIHEWKILCYNKNTGKLLWDRTACRGVPAMKRHPKSTHANTTAATNGEVVAVFFGSEGLYCYDMTGKLLWTKNFGKLKSVFFVMKNAEWEFASSPVIYNGVLIVQCDVLENSFVAAFDAKSGKALWKTERDEYPGWCTPNVYTNSGKTYIALNGFKHIGGYDFETGKEVWRMSGGGDIPIPTPVAGKDLIYFNSAHGPRSPILAIKNSATGNITLKEGETKNNGVEWSMPRGGSYMHTLLLYHDRLYNVDWNGTVSCYEPHSGKLIYTGKLGKSDSFIASPVASDGKIYIVSEEGIVHIIKDGDSFVKLGEIQLNDVCMTAPAITDGMIFFRTQKYLIAAGKN